MPRNERDPIKDLHTENLIELTRRSITEANAQNPNALGVVIHGSRAHEGKRWKKQPRKDSDLDVVTIRKNADDDASTLLGNALFRNIGANNNILIDTGMWGSIEWENVGQAVISEIDKRKFCKEWKHLRDSPIIIGADSEIEDMVRKALLE